MHNSYEPGIRSKVKRAHQRGRYDYESVHAALDCGLLCHIGYVIDGQPYVTPTLYWRKGHLLFWHGSSASRMLRRFHTPQPACVTVTWFDGFVMARSGFHHSVNYRSVMAFGKAQLLRDKADKNDALDALMERVASGRLTHLRAPLEKEIKATSVVWMEIEEASLKVRDGPPIDDEEDYDLDCWAGVLPIEARILDPVDDPRLKAGTDVPDHISALVGKVL
ncbi:MAG: pyridoxamine 5'-phosphate oxidase family protein, partial [Pseudomonadota bacterium]